LCQAFIAKRTYRMKKMLLSLLSLLLLVACGSPATVAPSAAPADPAATAAPTSAPEPTAEPIAEAVDAAFPVTIEHRYGKVEISKAPERIAVVGLVEQDSVLALGSVPIATSEWFGGYEGSIWPWAQDELAALGGETPVGIANETGGTNIELLASLKPDLIVAMYSGITEDEYKLLSQIAPTLAQPVGANDYGVSWQEALAVLGTAMGKSELAAEITADIESRFAQIRADHPDWQGKSVLIAAPYNGIWVYGEQDPRSRLFKNMGFVLPSEIAELLPEGFGGNISLERTDLLDNDLLIWLNIGSGGEPPYEAELYNQLKAHTEGREIFLDSFEDAFGGAASFNTPLSLPFLLDGLVPLIELAVDGDPNTIVE
jgi:iron complex transport system substrate-binding protein